MNEQTLIWLFGATGLWLLSLTSVVYWIKGDTGKVRLAVELFIAENGKGAAIVLHSPDDHLGLDVFLDKYIANHHDLQDGDWMKLKLLCERIQTDRTISQEERLAASNLLAAMMAQLALHKINRIPPEVMSKLKSKL